MNEFQLKLDLFEEWLPIEGYDGYEVSNFGKVKSLGNDKTRKEKILKPSTNKDGYQVVCLYKDGKPKMYFVHRLVASTFIPNPNNLPQVNHKDEVKTNNHISNLEWCDCKYNNNYGTVCERHSKSMIGKYSGENNPMYGKLGKEHPNAKQVIQLSLNGDIIKIWGSMMDVERKLGCNLSSISNCCKGKRKSAYKYKWCYA